MLHFREEYKQYLFLEGYIYLTAGMLDSISHYILGLVNCDGCACDCEALMILGTSLLSPRSHVNTAIQCPALISGVTCCTPGIIISTLHAHSV